MLYADVGTGLQAVNLHANANNKLKLLNIITENSANPERMATDAKMWTGIICHDVMVPLEWIPDILLPGRQGTVW